MQLTQIGDYPDEQIQETEGSDISEIRLTWARGPKHTPSLSHEKQDL